MKVETKNTVMAWLFKILITLGPPAIAYATASHQASVKHNEMHAHAGAAYETLAATLNQVQQRVQQDEYELAVIKGFLMGQNVVPVEKFKSRPVPSKFEQLEQHSQ